MTQVWLRQIFPPGTRRVSRAVTRCPVMALARVGVQAESNAPSRSANNESGEQTLNNHLGSILFHPLGLPLACALHGKDPAELDYLAQTSNYFPKNKQAFDTVLGDVLAAWETKVETDLTTALAISIDSNKKIPLRGERQGERW